MEVSQSLTPSTGITTTVAVTIPLTGLLYAVGFYLLYRYSQHHPKALNKVSGVRLQRYAPFVYIFLIVSSLVEVGLGSWLLAQYHHTGFYPNTGTRDGVRLALFAACWTLLSSTLYLSLFFHPTLSKHPVASVGAQALWVLVSWCLWIAATATMNRAMPLLIAGATCVGSVFCRELQSVFAFAVLELLVLTLSMLIMAWLVWWNTRNEAQRPPLPR